MVLTREPGGSPGAEAIRQLLVTGETDRWTARTEALLHFAAREDHLARTIRPALARGAWVISDRFVDSTFAYQGIAQGLGEAAIKTLSALVIGEDMPALTLILDLPVDLGLSRAHRRAGADNSAEDRYERMDTTFHQTLRNAFLSIAHTEPQRCVVIDAASDTDDVARQIWHSVTSRLVT